MAFSTIGRMLRRVRADQSKSVANDPAVRTAGRMMLSSPAFDDGGAIPTVNSATRAGDNRSPALNWSGVPGGTQQLLLIIEDVDVPFPRPLIHSIAVLSPAATQVTEGALVTSNHEIRFAPAGLGRRGYQGPAPIPGHGPHHYGFHLYALDLAIPASTERKGIKGVLSAVDGHVLAAAHLIGTHEQG
jgi:Raf kinase inhibitor-like YbhB/YbcL family protein